MSLKEIQGLKMHLQPRSGASFDATLPLAAIHDRTGKLVASRCQGYNIPKRKLAEEEIRQLKTANQRKDQFLAMLAHELRNSLSVILGAVEVLKLPRMPEPSLHQAQKIMERQVRHQSRILDDLFNLTRIAHGKISLHCKHLDLIQLVRDGVEDRRIAMAEAGLMLIQELPDGPVWVMGDPTWLSQILGNLLHNAVKFTDPGGQVIIRVEVNRHAHRAVVTVRDTGRGIAPDLLAHIFEPFTQLDHGPDGGGGGLGLGLALVKGLVELHGGEVRVYSQGLRRGSEFAFQLPLACPPVVRQEKGLHPTSTAAKSFYKARLYYSNNKINCLRYSRSK